jgi:hypothetical protein
VALEARITELGCGLLALDAAAPERGQLTEIVQRLGCDVLIAN